jgi:uncharacterized protein
MSERTVERPLPDQPPRMAPFWSAAAEGRLVLQRCGACRSLYFPAVETCSACLRDDRLEWTSASGRGEVFSYVVMHQLYHPAFAAEVPYTVVDVKLEEGPRMISRLADGGAGAVRVGMPVEVTFVHAGENVHLPMFRPRT